MEPSLEAKPSEYGNGTEPVINGEALEAADSKVEDSGTTPLETPGSSGENARQVSPAEHAVEIQAETQMPIEDVSETKEDGGTTAVIEVANTSPSEVEENQARVYDHGEPEGVDQNESGVVSTAEMPEPEHSSKSIEMAQYEDGSDDSQGESRTASPMEKLNMGTQVVVTNDDSLAHGENQSSAEVQQGNEYFRSNDESPIIPSMKMEDRLENDELSIGHGSFSHEDILSDETVAANDETLNREASLKDVGDIKDIFIDTSLDYEPTPKEEQTPCDEEPSNQPNSSAHENAPIEIEQSPVPENNLDHEKSKVVQSSSDDEASSIIGEHQIGPDSKQVENDNVIEDSLDPDQILVGNNSISQEGTAGTAQEDVVAEEYTIPLEEIERNIPENTDEGKNEDILAADRESIEPSPTTERPTSPWHNEPESDSNEERQPTMETGFLQPESSEKAPEGPDFDDEEADGCITPTVSEAISQRPTTPVTTTHTNSHGIEESPATVLNVDDLFADEDEDEFEHQPPEQFEAAVHTPNSQALDSVTDLSKDCEHAPQNLATETASKTLAMVLEDHGTAQSQPTAQQPTEDNLRPEGVFASLVDVIRPDISLVRELSETSGQEEPDRSANQVVGNDFSHGSLQEHMHDEDSSDNESLLHQAVPSHPSKYPALHESDIAFHINTHKTNAVPSFETYAHSDDADSNPSTPIDEILDIAQEVLQNEHLISSSWPESRVGDIHMHEQEQDLKAQASPLQAGFEPYSPRLYSGVITPKSSRVDLKNNQESPESMVHSSPDTNEGHEYHVSRASRTSSPSALDPSHSRDSSGDGYYDAPLSRKHSYHESQPDVQPSTDQNPITPSSRPNSSLFQRTRSLFESSSSQVARSIPSPVGMSKLAGIGSGGLKDSIHNPARGEKAPLLGGEDGDGY